MALAPSILEIWKSVHVWIVCLDPLNSNFFIFRCARRALAKSSKKVENVDFPKKAYFVWRAERAHMQCAPMYSPDPGDAFWLLDCYSSSKIGENRFAWSWLIFENFENFQKKSIFFNKNSIFDKISSDSIFTNVLAIIAIK